MSHQAEIDLETRLSEVDAQFPITVIPEQTGAAAIRSSAASAAPSHNPEQQALYTRPSEPNELLGDEAVPSTNHKQWLADQHLANAAFVADAQPSGSVPIILNYPRPAHLVPKIFGLGPAQRIFNGERAVLVQQYCKGLTGSILHWSGLRRHSTTGIPWARHSASLMPSIKSSASLHRMGGGWCPSEQCFKPTGTAAASSWRRPSSAAE